MVKPNYAFAKRQRDMAKKQKKEEKRLRKTELTTDEAVAKPDDVTLADGAEQDPSLPTGSDTAA